MHMSHAEHVLAHFTPPCVSFVMLFVHVAVLDDHVAVLDDHVAVLHDHVDDHFSGTLKHTSTQSYIIINTYIIIMTKMRILLLHSFSLIMLF